MLETKNEICPVCKDDWTDRTKYLPEFSLVSKRMSGTYYAGKVQCPHCNFTFLLKNDLEIKEKKNEN